MQHTSYPTVQSRHVPSLLPSEFVEKLAKPEVLTVPQLQEQIHKGVVSYRIGEVAMLQISNIKTERALPSILIDSVIDEFAVS